MSDVRINFDQWRNQRKYKGVNTSAAEIEKIIKRALEGCNLFEEWSNAINQKPSPYQKAKLEGLMRDEIRKLKRLREVMKQWIGWDFFKNKDAMNAITDLKKHIETLMGQWRILEKDSKRKAYSKEGLDCPQDVDPFQRKCNEVHNWFVVSIDNLGVQIDIFESEIETLSTIKKNKLSKEKKERIDILKYFITKHKYHIRQLEKLLRTLDNLSFENEDERGIVYKEEEDLHQFFGKVCDIKEDIEYYIQSNMEEDFQENIYIYEELAYICEKDNNSSTQEIQAAEDKAVKYSVSVSDLETVFPSSGSGNSNGSMNAEDVQKIATLVSTFSKCKLVSIGGEKYEKDLKTNDTDAKDKSNCNDLDKPGAKLGCSISMARLEHSRQDDSEDLGDRESQVQESDIQKDHSENSDLMIETAVPIPAWNGEWSSFSSSYSSSEGNPTLCGEYFPEPAASLEFYGHEIWKPLPNGNTASRSFADTVRQSSLKKETRDNWNDANSYGTYDGFVPPFLGAVPLGGVPLQPHEMEQSAILEAAFHHIPHMQDSKPRKQVLPQFPCETPSYYPQSPLPAASTEEFYSRLDVETLFFIFYFCIASKAQMYAAKGLRAKGWRYHRKLCVWIQRLETPMKVTYDYEQGNVMSFQLETWSAIKRDAFVFEFADMDQNPTYK